MTDEIRDEELDDGALVAAARRLGARAAGELDLERTARGVVARWRAERNRSARPIWRSPTLWRMAAAIVLLVGGVEAWEHAHRPPDEVVAVEPVDAGLEGLSSEQLQALLPTVTEPGAVELTASDAGLEGLTPDELRSVLRAMGS